MGDATHSSLWLHGIISGAGSTLYGTMLDEEHPFIDGPECNAFAIDGLDISIRHGKIISAVAHIGRRLYKINCTLEIWGCEPPPDTGGQGP
jgi:hypothetical protein